MSEPTINFHTGGPVAKPSWLRMPQLAARIFNTPLAIHPGIRICQIVLERTEGHAVYHGRFSEQVSP